jgi:hypothetical protein
MAITLTVELGSASANSLASRSYAKDYFAVHQFGSEWGSLNPAVQDARLMQAMRVFNGLSLLGQRVDSTQALDFPRKEREGIDDDGLYDKRGRYWPSDEIPSIAKDAQCEIALAMELDPSLNNMALRQAILKTGDLTLDHRKPAHYCVASAIELLSPLLASGMVMR